jgi:hypothetical protein
MKMIVAFVQPSLRLPGRTVSARTKRASEQCDAVDRERSTPGGET